MQPSDYCTVRIGVSPFWAAKYARESPKHWENFYRRNKTNFYRDRHWTATASTDGFPCLSTPSPTADTPTILIEAGCGVANCALPLLAVNPSLYIYAFDFAPSAINLAKQRDEYDPTRCRAFVWDFCRQPFSQIDVAQRGQLAPDSADYCMLIFVLSSVPPEQQLAGLRNLFALLKPGGKLLFRDYASGDMAQKRFASRNMISDNYFVRQDSTLSYFFNEDALHNLLTRAGFEKDYMRRVNRTITNRKENLEMHRVFLQAVYTKKTTRLKQTVVC